MTELAGVADTSGWSVRGLVKQAENSRCPTAQAAFAARVDLNRLVSDIGTVAAEYGQSPFMITRGKAVERRARENSYAELIPILRDKLGFTETDVATMNLKEGFPPSNEGFRRRGLATSQAVSAILRGDPDAPNILEGAVLEAQFGSRTGRFEADAIGAHVGPVLNGLEIKSWPVVDGRADDSGKAAEAFRQLGFYVFLLKVLVDTLGFDADAVSSTGLLITPTNTSMRLQGNTRDLSRDILLAQSTVAGLPDPDDYVGVFSADEGFGPASRHGGKSDAERLEHLNILTDRIGTAYQPSCMTSCGLAKFCRAKEHNAASPAVCGSTPARLLSGVRSLDRAALLSEGAPPTDEEDTNGVATVLANAGRLYDNALQSGSGAA
jgi:hypothetical protein